MTALKKQITQLPQNYLFVEIGQRVAAYRKKHPKHSILSLGIGDVSQPLAPSIAQALTSSASAMAQPTGMQGYGSEHGKRQLRETIARQYTHQGISADDIFVQDGSKPALARLLSCFKAGSTIATLTPTFPAFFDAAMCHIHNLNFISIEHSPNAPPMSASSHMHRAEASTPEPFTHLLQSLQRASPDAFILCHPNNPDGFSLTPDQLGELVALAKRIGMIIIHDSAYSSFITDEETYSSLYSVEGACDVVIEIASLSKSHGFSGLRLGWVCLPAALADSSLRMGAQRSFECSFNGASCTVQDAALAALSPQGQAETKQQRARYMQQAQLIRNTLTHLGWHIGGAAMTPFVWACPSLEIFQESGPLLTSWEIFNSLLTQHGIVCTPGSGFGRGGDGFVRFSGFGKSEDIATAMERLRENNSAGNA